MARMTRAPEARLRPSPRDIWRTALTPRWLMALAALLAFIVTCFFLGRWQWDRTQDILDAERAAAADPALLSDIVDDDGTWPNAEIGRTVILEGTFTNDQTQLLNRELEGERGSWTFTGFRLNAGSSVAVMRGWLPEGVASPAPPEESMRILGVLHPNEAFYEGANENGIVTADSGALSALWGVPLIEGYVMLQDEDPALASAESDVLQIVPPTVQVGDVPFPLQNFFYAIQWWVFAAFAIFVYARWLYLDARK